MLSPIGTTNFSPSRTSPLLRAYSLTAASEVAYWICSFKAFSVALLYDTSVCIFDNWVLSRFNSLILALKSISKKKSKMNPPITANCFQSIRNFFMCQYYSTFSRDARKKAAQTKIPLFAGLECRRRDLNPHERIAHYALNVARLPVPPLRRSGMISILSVYKDLSTFYTQPRLTTRTTVLVKMCML